MERRERIAIAKQVLGMIDRDEIQYGEEPAWEADIGRFTDKDRFLKEKDEFFLNRAQVLAYTADLPNNGDYYATEIAGKPILLTRGKDGQVHAFLNACRHRGAQVAQGCGHASTFTCPYHAWTYNLQGDLIGVPSKDSFDGMSAGRGLVALPVHEEIGIILVHPQPDGVLDFDEFLGPMKSIIAGYHCENLRFVKEIRTKAKINWKHAVDGAVEGYHVPFLHPQTVGPMVVPQMLHIDSGMHHTLITVQTDIVKLKDLPEEEWPEFCYFSCTNAIFPNTVLGTGEMISFLQRSDPGAEPGDCDYIFRTYGWGHNPTEEERQRDEYVADMLIGVAMDEDMKIQSNTQVIMEAGAVPSLIFGRHEQNVSRMHRNYDRLIGHDVEAALRKDLGEESVREAAE